MSEHLVNDIPPSVSDPTILRRIPGAPRNFGEMAIFSPAANTFEIAVARIYFAGKKVTASYIGPTEGDDIERIVSTRHRFIGPLITYNLVPNNDNDLILAKVKFGADTVYVISPGAEVGDWGIWDSALNPYNVFSEPDANEKERREEEVRLRSELSDLQDQLQRERAISQQIDGLYREFLERQETRLNRLNVRNLGLGRDLLELQRRYDKLRKDLSRVLDKNLETNLALFGFTTETFAELSPEEMKVILANLKRGLYSGLHPDRLKEIKLKGISQEVLKEANAALERIAQRFGIEL